MYATSIAKEYRNELSILLGCVRSVEAFLGPEDDWVEEDRRILYEAVDGLLGHTMVTEGNEDDYVCTTNSTPNDVENALHPTFERNLVSTRKYREHHTGGRQWACGSWVMDLGSDQLHVYLFETKYGNTDVYAHLEPAVTSPVEHLDTSTGVHGDPTGVIVDVLGMNNIPTTERNV